MLRVELLVSHRLSYNLHPEFDPWFVGILFLSHLVRDNLEVHYNFIMNQLVESNIAALFQLFISNGLSFYSQSVECLEQ